MKWRAAARPVSLPGAQQLSLKAALQVLQYSGAEHRGDTQMQLVTSSERWVKPQLDKGAKTLGHLSNRWMSA